MEIFLKSLISAILVGGVLWISKVFGPRIAGIFAMVPLLFTLSFLFVTMGEKSVVEIKHFLSGGVVGIIIFLVFTGTLYFLTRDSQHYWQNLLLSYGVWFALAFTWIYFFKK